MRQLFGWNNFQQNFAVGKNLLVLLGMLASIAICSGANAETRKLKLYYLHTGEKATIAYKKNGKFLSNGLKKLNYFLRDWRRNEPTRMDPNLMDLIWEVYKKSGSRDYIHVISGYRSPTTNNMLRKRGRGVAKNSQHTLGKAMDFFLPDVKLAKLRKIGLIKQAGGVGYYPRSGSPFVHMDTGGVRHWPPMSRRELVRVFPRGKTLHVPTDGKPLSGYNQAVAAYNKRKSSSKKIPLASGDEKQRKSFFARLASLGNDDDDEGAVPYTPNKPKKVKAVIKPAIAVPDIAKPAEENNLAVPKPEPQDVPSKPELPLLANIPVPRSAPRQELIAGKDAKADNVVLARLNNKDEILLPQNAPGAATDKSSLSQNLTSIDDQETNQEITQNAELEEDNLVRDPSPDIPVPSVRPQIASTQIAQAENVIVQTARFDDNRSSDNSQQLATITTQQLRNNLINQANNKLRSQLAPVLRPSRDVGPSFETAFLSPQDEPSKGNNSLLTRSLDATPQIENTSQDQNPNLIPSKRPQLIATNSDAPSVEKLSSADVNQANVRIENGANDLPKKSVTLPQEQDVEITVQETAPYTSIQAENSQLALATVPTPAPRLVISPTKSANTNNSTRARIIAASTHQNNSQSDLGPLGTSPNLSDTNASTKFIRKNKVDLVLAEINPIESTAILRAPTYSLAALRRSPKTVLSAGFNRSASLQLSTSFKTKLTGIYTFTKFN